MEQTSRCARQLLRLDVDHGGPYTIRPDNPYRNHPPYRPEIWAWGLRNPWRFCFDRVTGLLYIADVGQNHWEEIDAAPASAAGLNYGWNVMEGSHCYKLPWCDPKGFTLPVVEYDHSQGCSVIGGFVYRGRAIPALVGHYVYADYCSGWVRSFKFEHGVVSEHRQWLGLEPGQVLSLGEDAAGTRWPATAWSTGWPRRARCAPTPPPAGRPRPRAAPRRARCAPGLGKPARARVTSVTSSPRLLLAEECPQRFAPDRPLHGPTIPAAASARGRTTARPRIARCRNRSPR